MREVKDVRRMIDGDKAEGEVEVNRCGNSQHQHPHQHQY